MSTFHCKPGNAALPQVPLAADARITGLTTLGGPAIILTYLDADGRPVARSVATPDEIEAHGRDLLAAAHAARAADPKVVPFGRTISRSRLMNGLSAAPHVA